MLKILKISTIFLSLLVTACSMKAPPYQASMENVTNIKTANINTPVKIAKISSTQNLNKISIRGSKMTSPIGVSYGDYLSKALEAELKLAKLWSGVSSTVISGKLITNDIDATGFSKGYGDISAQFIVTRNNKIIFDKVISAKHQFDSSFVGAIAIPNAQQSYVDLTQKLIKNLFNNKEFIKALRS
jgi:hypothetical protein